MRLDYAIEAPKQLRRGESTLIWIIHLFSAGCSVLFLAAGFHRLMLGRYPDEIAQLFFISGAVITIVILAIVLAVRRNRVRKGRRGLRMGTLAVFAFVLGLSAFIPGFALMIVIPWLTSL